MFFFFQAEDGIRDLTVTGVQTCALPIFMAIESATRFRRPVYAGNAILTVESSGEDQVVGTVRTASFAAAALGGAAPIEKAAFGAQLPAHPRFAAVSAPRIGHPDLQTARRGNSRCRSPGSG